MDTPQDLDVLLTSLYQRADITMAEALALQAAVIVAAARWMPNDTTVFGTESRDLVKRLGRKEQ